MRTGGEGPVRDCWAGMIENAIQRHSPRSHQQFSAAVSDV